MSVLDQSSENQWPKWAEMKIFQQYGLIFIDYHLEAEMCAICCMDSQCQQFVDLFHKFDPKHLFEEA